MKKIIALCTALLLLQGTFAQTTKVIERSAPKAPEWIGISMPDYVIVSAEEATLDGARQRCLNDIRQAVVNAVAVNITSEETSTESQDRYNLSTSVYGRYESQVKTVAGRLPFISGIALSKGETYWEKCLEKKSKRTYYICHVKYPFSRGERLRLTEEFLRQDREQYEKYLELKRNLDTFTQVEYIDRAIVELEPLIAYFFDDLRRNEAEALRSSYRQLYTRITAVPCQSAPGEHFFALELDGRRVTTSHAPKIKSSCATGVEVVPGEDGRYRVTWDESGCLDGDDQTIELVYLLGGRPVRHTIRFDARQSRMKVTPFGEIELDVYPDAKDSGSVRIVGYLSLRSQYDMPFEVLSLDLTAEGIGQRLSFTMSNYIIEGKGTHRIEFITEWPTALSDRRSALAQGVLELRNPQTNRTEEVRFKLPYKISLM